MEVGLRQERRVRLPGCVPNWRTRCERDYGPCHVAVEDVIGGLEAVLCLLVLPVSVYQALEGPRPEKFLDGRPNGVWDQRSQDAMQKFQGANGWQTKMVPDARAIIKLGLGPDHADLINPETAATSFIPGGGGGSAQR